MTIIIRREDDEGDDAHHGGAWKVAYADFVTAMMAFFMLMWLLNATTEAQRTGLADYFAPTNLFGRSISGSGKPFGGKTPNDTGSNVSTDGAPEVIKGRLSPQLNVERIDDAETPATPAIPFARADDAPDDGDDAGLTSRDDPKAATALQPGQGLQAVARGGDYAAARLIPASTPTDPAALDSARRETPFTQQPTAQPAPSAEQAAAQSDAEREQRTMQQAAAQLLDAIHRDPALQDIARQIMVDNQPEGLRIQVVDAERQPMFALGSASPTPRVKELMQKVVPVLAKLPNAITIAGHTDALTYRGPDKDNWQLSTDRANATRKILVEAGLAEQRIRSVTAMPTGSC